MILSYETVKYVSIQDSRLGLLRYLLMFVIFIYVGYIEMYAHGGYLYSDILHGVLRFTVQQPTIHNCDPFNDINENNMTTTCENNFLPLSELSYCQTKETSYVNSSYNSNIATENKSDVDNDYHGNVYPCEYYEAINAQIISETSVTILTRGKVLNQTFICSGDNHNDSGSNTNDTCPHTYQTILPPSPVSIPINITKNTSTTTTIKPFYVAQSEAFTILIDHAVTATKLCSMTSSSVSTALPYTCSSTSSQYNYDTTNKNSHIRSGRLYTTNKELCQQFASIPSMFAMHNNSRATSSCYIEPNVTVNHLDYFSMDVLIRAAGINSLDDCIDGINNTINNSDYKCTTYRESGATFMVHVLWNDFIPYHGMVQPYYYYRVQLINRSYKTYIPYYHPYYRSGGRTLLIAHGIRFVFVLGGEFHTFHTTTFLITLTTALGLFAVATTIIDYLMIYILPEKEKYTKAKYEATDVIHPVEIPTSMVPSFIHQNLSTMATIREPEVAVTQPENANVVVPSTVPNDADENTLEDPLLLQN